MDERVENLRRYGVMREIERRSVCDCDYQAYLYLLDRCARVVDRDWGYSRLLLRRYFPTGGREMAQYFHPDSTM